MPDGKGGKDLKDAKKFAKALGIDLRIIGIAPIVNSLENRLLGFQADQVARGNLRARARMIILYFIANTEGGIVMATGNKSELLTGSFTLFGDGASDFLPIGDLYKTQVREMARYLALPPEIVEKVPTGGLWPGQTDEGELGISYDELDRILLGIELQLEPEAIAQKAGVPLDHVAYVQKLVMASVHKRKMPLVPKVGARTIGLDWREEASSFLERHQEPLPGRDIENDFGCGQSAPLPETPRALPAGARQIRSAPRHEQPRRPQQT